MRAPRLPHDARRESKLCGRGFSPDLMLRRQPESGLNPFYEVCEVHPRLCGRGIAAVLVDTALQHARETGLRVDPLCSHVRVYT